ncbi:MAG TPA: dihydropteroate synthase [Gemmatimonadales bacterium]|nr:dihydropteroate synthase [Gemmatimonadales bacterium]
MRLVPLAGRPEDAIREALLSHGWEGDLSRTAAAGIESLAYQVTGAEPATLEALVRAASRLGLDVITGPDWALVAGSRVRLSALARPAAEGGGDAPLAGLAAQLGPALPGEEPAAWETAAGPISLDGPVLVGILNPTPDSFSDGGRYRTVDAALDRAGQLLAAGATVLDIGGESTRPGGAPVSEMEERARVAPVVEAVARRFPDAVISVDTTKASVARAGLDAGAAIINDVSGLRLDPALAGLVAEREAGLVLMHSRGGAGSLASEAHAGFPDGVIPAVVAELGQAIERAREAGVRPGRIVVDPGLGFGKSPEQSVELLRGLGALRRFERPVLIGPSRKRFLGALTGRPVEERDIATAAACALGWAAGARLFRVHEPGPVRDALALARAFRPR